MDTYERIYARAKARGGEMNAHVIRRGIDALRPRYFETHIEPVHRNWDRVNDVIDKTPDLIIVHYSSLLSTTPGLRNFLVAVLDRSPNTQIVVYSRDKDSNFTNQLRRLVGKHQDRIHGFPVDKHGDKEPNFQNAIVMNDLAQLAVKVTSKGR